MFELGDLIFFMESYIILSGKIFVKSSKLALPMAKCLNVLMSSFSFG